MIVHILENVSLNSFEIRDSLVPVFCEMFGLLQALIVSCCGCFHGRTLGVISMSCDNDATRGFGPLVPGHLKVDFGDIDGLEKIFKGKLICLFVATIFYTIFEYLHVHERYLIQSMARGYVVFCLNQSKEKLGYVFFKLLCIYFSKSY